MNVGEISERVAEIALVAATDSEKAHILEDKLRADFVAHVVSLGEKQPELSEMARAVQFTDKLNFKRWAA